MPEMTLDCPNCSFKFCDMDLNEQIKTNEDLRVWLKSRAGVVRYWCGGCGNAYDPSVYGFWEAPRALGFIQLRLEVKLVGDAAIDASSTWEEAIRTARGEEYVLFNSFNCEDHFNPQAAAAFRDIPITRITIGTHLQLPGC